MIVWLNDPYPQFKVTSFFDAEYLINGKTHWHSFNEILIGTYTLPTQQCHYEWPWVTLSELAKYSMTRSIARSLCDSWASCWKCADVVFHMLVETTVQLTKVGALFRHSVVDIWHETAHLRCASPFQISHFATYRLSRAKKILTSK